MSRLATALLALVALLLPGCGEYVPPTPTRSAIEDRQTAVALGGRPTLAPLPPRPTATPGPPIPDLLQISADDPRALGDPDAPVLIVEFTDFECPFCQQFVRETKPQLIEQFVNTGQVRLVVRDFPLTDIHPSALPAAVAAQCAGKQGQYWAMYDQLFATYRLEWGGVPNRDRQVFREFAQNLNLDMPTFNVCLDDPDHETAILAEQQAALRLGVNSTPNFLVNGQLLRGALPFRAFADLIAQETSR